MSLRHLMLAAGVALGVEDFEAVAEI